MVFAHRPVTWWTPIAEPRSNLQSGSATCGAFAILGRRKLLSLAALDTIMSPQLAAAHQNRTGRYMEETGYDLTAHKSKSLDEVLALEYDAVINGVALARDPLRDNHQASAAHRISGGTKFCKSRAPNIFIRFRFSLLAHPPRLRPNLPVYAEGRKLLRSNSSSGGPRSARVIRAPGAPRKVCRLTGQLWPDLADGSC
jgi:hypothetical protein